MGIRDGRTCRTHEISEAYQERETLPALHITSAVDGSFRRLEALEPAFERLSIERSFIPSKASLIGSLTLPKILQFPTLYSLAF